MDCHPYNLYFRQLLFRLKNNFFKDRILNKKFKLNFNQ